MPRTLYTLALAGIITMAMPYGAQALEEEDCSDEIFAEDGIAAVGGGGAGTAAAAGCPSPNNPITDMEVYFSRGSFCGLGGHCGAWVTCRDGTRRYIHVDKPAHKIPSERVCRQLIEEEISHPTPPPRPRPLRNTPKLPQVGEGILITPGQPTRRVPIIRDQ